MKTFKEKATSLVLLAITVIGGFLVGEQVISGEQLAEVQGVTGMALAGGGLTLSTVLYTIRVLVPKQLVENALEKVGRDKVDRFFNEWDKALVQIQELTNKVQAINNELALVRQEKEQLLNELNG